MKHEFRLIVSGGRDVYLTQYGYEKLDYIDEKHRVTLVLHGDAKGVDSCAESWAYSMNIPTAAYPPDWDRLGKKAGPIRNRQMAENADAVIVFPGGAGTQSMYKIAKDLGIIVWDERGIGEWYGKNKLNHRSKY